LANDAQVEALVKGQKQIFYFGLLNFLG
jgi:hypothetical protein